MSTTAFKPGDLVQITKRIFNVEGLVKGDIVEVAENISSSPQEFTSIIMPSGKVLSWLNDRFEKIDSWTNTTLELKRSTSTTSRLAGCAPSCAEGTG